MVSAASVTASPLRSVIREEDVRAFKLWSSLVAPAPSASSPPVAKPATADRHHDRIRQAVVDLGNSGASSFPADASRGGKGARRTGGGGGGAGYRGQGERSSLIPLASVLSPSFAFSFALDALRLEVVGGAGNGECGLADGARDRGTVEAAGGNGSVVGGSGCGDGGGSCLPRSMASSHSAAGVGGGGSGGGGGGGERGAGGWADGKDTAGFDMGLGERRRRRRWRPCLPRDGTLSAVVEIKGVRVETKKTAAAGDMDTEKVGSRVIWRGTRGGREEELTPCVLLPLFSLVCAVGSCCCCR